MTKCGGWARDVKNRPHLRVVVIPIPHNDKRTFEVPKGCRLVSHTTFMQAGKQFMQLVVDISHQSLGDESPMPADWDYRKLLRDGNARSPSR